ncbi:GNAT family N-acetyltransferase [Roseivirga pacifica]|uniref:GNAT family N-acetyltransferase n=1 Tax=Roseivirga pacifica TaxID=1267423 RepID=UPI00227CB9B8|nr:GNAT family protein [Roseivirga pacifica]
MKEYSSERLLVREIKNADIDKRLLSWFDNPELMKFYTNSRNKITKEVLLDSIERGKNEGNNFTFLVCNRLTGQSIGTLKLGPINKAHRTSDLVALIGDRSSINGGGVGTEAIEIGNRIAFTEFDLRKLYGGMYKSNIASIKAYTRAGWIVEGKLKGQFLVDGVSEDRILVGCFNPNYFTEKEILEARDENWYQED